MPASLLHRDGSAADQAASDAPLPLLTQRCAPAPVNLTQEQKDLVESYMPKAALMAHECANLYPSLCREDLVQAGFLGLCTAAIVFDPVKGSFANWASFWIRKHLLLQVAEASWIIRLPDRLARRLSRKRRVEAGMVQELGRRPSFAELASAVAEAECITGEQAVTLLERLNGAEESVLSLDAPVGPDGVGTLGDFVVDPTSPGLYEVLDVASTRTVVRELLGELKPRWRYVLEGHLGIESSGPKTFSQIAAELCVTPQRVQQMFKQAIQEFRRLWMQRNTSRTGTFGGVVRR